LVDGYEEQAGTLPDLENLRIDDEEESK